MKRLKILFLTRDRSQQMEKSSYYIAEEMKKQCDLMLWTEDGHILKILTQLPDKPDFIFLNDFLDPRLCPQIVGLEKVNIPKGMIFHDISYKIQERKEYVKKNKIDFIFPHYRDAFLRWYPELAHRLVWLPHHVNIEVYKDFQLPKTINWLIMGAIVRHIYPLREIMLNTMKNQPGFVYHPHPGYTEVQNVNSGSLIGDDYAKEINRSKMFLTCNSVYGYTLMKYFEVLGCNTLLMAPATKETTDLGLIDGVHFIAVNRDNFMEKAKYYLIHEEERKAISQNGYEFVRAHHSTKARVQHLLENISTLLS
ncbi:glycosyltransferase [uncultured Metabacillus sp.]|uniref:glycosyltransferase family protein n=1 Tax=uncultured Metabacillus sp. TaxID=2860135 RepID=UPI0026395A01|nr:glycosyltransferase [uncultured Metabacillus sp.]